MVTIITAFLKFLFQNRQKIRSMNVMVCNGQFRLETGSEVQYDLSDLDDQRLIADLEKDIDTFWRTVPFHSIFLVYGLPIENSRLGGTCTDRAVFFFDYLKDKYPDSLNLRLHRALIKGNETHTIILVTIGNETYLIDIGANWPVMKLIPCFKEFEFSAFGICFNSKPSGNLVKVFMQRPEDPEFQEFLTVDMTPQSTEYVDNQISQRFDPNNQLPFANGLRYAAVHGNTFYFLKQDNALIKERPFSTRSYNDMHLKARAPHNSTSGPR